MRRLLPPRLFLLTIVAMVVSHHSVPIATVLTWPYRMFGAPFVILGLGFALWGSWRFEAAGTNIKTFNQPDHLVTDGLFRYSRNPMYLGFVIALAGAWLCLGTLTPVAGVAAFFVITAVWYIPFEERALASKFGDAYATYCNSTRRWI